MVLYDLHCHSKLSLCAARDSEISEFIRCAEEDGLVCVGISDHAWDKGVGRPIEFYRDQPYEKLLERERLQTNSTKLFLGAEGEYAQGLLGVRRSTIEKLDYIIIPHSHIHMNGFVLPEGVKDDHAVGRHLFNSFVSLLHHPDSDRFFGVAHPFWPCGRKLDQVNEILKTISDEEFIYCGKLAKEKGVFLEVNMSCVCANPIDKFEESEYCRFFRLAKKGGAEFFIGSDNHSPKCGKNNCINRLPEYASILGFDDGDFKTALSRILRA